MYMLVAKNTCAYDNENMIHEIEDFRGSVAKRVLLYSIAIAFLVFAYSAVSYVKTYSNAVEPGTYRSFSVTGEGKVVAVPDVAEFTFSVITQGGKDLSKLQQENTERVNRAIGFVKSKGVDAKDIKTQGYNLEPRYQNVICKQVPRPMPAVESESYTIIDRTCPPPEIVGYTITQTVSVKVRDFTKIGELLAGAVSSGANSVSQLSFVIDDRAALENKAREEAIVKAQAKAKAIAKVGGFRLGKLISINEGWTGPISYARYEAFGKGGDAMPMAAPAPSIEPGSQEVMVSVTLIYEIR